MSNTSTAVAPLTVGSVQTGGNTYQPWPQQWTWPYRVPDTYVYPTTVVHPREEDYANEVVVERHEYDSTLRFFRTREKARTLVKEITVPNGLLDWLARATP